MVEAFTAALLSPAPSGARRAFAGVPADRLDHPVARDLVDVGTEFGARVTRRLREDGIAWLITVAADGTPQPNPVWFIWNGESALIYSVPRQAKVKNIERNPKVALHLDSRNSGDDIVILTGKAEIDSTARPLDRNDAYVGKYR